MMDIKRLRRNAQQTLRIADREDWSDTDVSRILANDALKAADVFEGLLAIAETNLKILQGVYDTPIETGLLGILEYGILEQAIAETKSAIAVAFATA